MQKETRYQPPGICQRLINFFMNAIVARGLKRITWGQAATQVPGADPATQGAASGLNDEEKTFHEAQGCLGDDLDYDEIQVHFIRNEEELDHWVPVDKTPFTEGDESQLVDGKAAMNRNRVVRVKGGVTNQSKASQESAARRGKALTEPNMTTSGSDRKKSVSIRDGGTVEDRVKDKGKSIASDRLAIAKEPKKPRERIPRHLFSVASNINEKSDEFIKSRKEAMKRNFSMEPRKG
ncbi:hypothetical protein K2173_002986 [Erythroxylum novogranatense]|uniref:Uncharacterized protein n=1 Tax=Erythroxylum novogranatense TaxID=1862640 RepID=A0AAV8S8G5_9ROSI|nr:hypothetical protein K2173_002986 [Erythroxylum novogranatense]